MRKTKKKPEIQISIMESPYRQDEKETIDDWYARYLSDPAAIITVCGNIYYRIIAKQEMTIDERNILLCNVDHRIDGKTGTCFTDENGNRFTVIGIEHIRFNGNIPEWYLEAPTWILERGSKEIGEYLTSEEKTNTSEK